MAKSKRKPIIMWVARDKDGTLILFSEKPHREGNGEWITRGGSVMLLEEEGFYPNLSWINEPLRVTLKIIKTKSPDTAG